MRRGGYAFFASRRCDIFTADLCNSIMPKTFPGRLGNSLLNAALTDASLRKAASFDDWGALRQN